MAQMAKLLKHGGRLVLVDMDMRTAFTMPPCSVYETVINDFAFPFGVQIGVDYAIGVRLHELMLEVGLTTEYITADQPIYRDGHEKHLWEHTWAAALPRVAAAGLLTAEQGEALITAAGHTASRDVWVAAAKMFAAVGAKPA